MAKKALNFKSKKAYKKWLSYIHIHGKAKGRTPIKIRGKSHRVKHSIKKRR